MSIDTNVLKKAYLTFGQWGHFPTTERDQWIRKEFASLDEGAFKQLVEHFNKIEIVAYELATKVFRGVMSESDGSAKLKAEFRMLPDDLASWTWSRALRHAYQ